MNRIRKHIQLLVCILAGGIFIASCLWLFMIYQGYQRGEEEYDALRRLASEDGAAGSGAAAAGNGTDADADGGADAAGNGAGGMADYDAEGQDRDGTDRENLPLITVNFTALAEVNPDLVGWIDFPGTDASYPVVQTTDNSFYLNKTYRKERNAAGSIFMDFRNSRSMTDSNTIIYGHNMKNGSMFGFLKNYREEAYYEGHPEFYYYTPLKIYRCRILSVYTLKADASGYPVAFSGQEAYTDYLERIKGYAAYHTGIEVSLKDRLIMLSTCNSNASTRFVIQAVISEV